VNFLGIDVRGLDLDAFFRSGRVLYLAGYAAWLLVLVRGRRRAGAAGPIGLALLVWALTTFPLQRPYGLQVPSDRLRQLWWCATAAAGNPPWESGIVEQRTIEPVWSLLVSLLALRDPARVLAVYPSLPVLGLVLTGAALAWAFRRRPLCGLFAAFFVLLASTQPLDYLEPFRNFWARHFLLKPNHALGLALVPVLVGVLSRPLTARRAAGAAALLAVLGWTFVVDWALFCASVVCYVLVAAARRRLPGRGELGRLATVLAGSAVLVAPYVLYLSRHFPNAVSLSAGGTAAAPTLSPWGDARPAAHSLFFLASFDLGPHFPLALFGAWTAWRRGRRGDLLWLGTLAAATLAWTATAALYATARARAADEVYFFLAFAVAVHAGIGAHAVVFRAAAAWRPARTRPRAGARRLAAAFLLLWFPFTLGWWWDPPRMDAHFATALAPVPAEMEALASWLRGHTRGTDVVLAGGDVAAWIPALSGRRVLRMEPGPQAAGAEPAELRDRWGVRVIVWEIPPGAVRWTSDARDGGGLVRGVYRSERFTAYLLGP